MTYQGARARPMESEERRVFAVSKIKLDASGHVSKVLWGEVNPKSNLDVGAQVIAPVADVIDAIHDGAQVLAVFPASLVHLLEQRFDVIEHEGGTETIALSPSAGANALAPPTLQDMARLDE